MKNGILGFLCGVVAMSALVMAIGHANSDARKGMDSAAVAPGAASFYEELAPPMPLASEAYSGMWIPGHWRPLGDGEVITEIPPMPTTPMDRRPGESFDEWEKRVAPLMSPTHPKADVVMIY